MKSKKEPFTRFLSIQEHNARVAGLHWDLRLCNGQKHGNCMVSWVIPRHKMPTDFDTYLAIQVEDHPWDYRQFEGTIANGYGAGTVKLVFAGETKVFYWFDTKIKFMYDTKTYLLMKSSNEKWFIKNVN